jgi:hypothetical protein
VVITGEWKGYGRKWSWHISGHLWAAGMLLLHHNNAPAHTTLLIREFLTKHSVLVFPQPLYSPALYPPDFSLFQGIKMTMNGRRFQMIEDIISIQQINILSLHLPPRSFPFHCH